MNKIIIEMEKIKDPYSGLGQFCLHLANELLPHNDISFYLPKREQALFPLKKTIEQKKIHKTISFLAPKAQVWHSIHQDSPYYPSNRDAKYLLTIHDLNYIFENKDIKKTEDYLKKLQKKIKRADGITFISEYTKNLVKQFFSIDNIPQKVIYNGICFKEGLEPQKPEGIPEGEFLFSVGTLLPKKNFHVLVDMLKHLPNDNIVLAGSLFHPYAQEIKNNISKLGLEKRFILLGTITEAEKIWLHQNCKAFLFPSLLEGFGLPVAEAMAQGKPLFLSRLTSLPEVGGVDAFYFDDFEGESMASVITQGLNHFTNEQKERLLKRAQIFNWKKAANDYYEFYKGFL